MTFITDDDLCSTCKRCLYRPGEPSGCHFNFLCARFTQTRAYFIAICPNYIQVEYPEQNWDTEIRCDWGHGCSEARRLPAGGDGAVFVCRYHYDQEALTYKVPPWEELKIWTSE